MKDTFEPNKQYQDLLIENSMFHKKVRNGSARYQSLEYRQLQKGLLDFELKLSSQEIIDTAEITFPFIGEP